MVSRGTNPQMCGADAFWRRDGCQRVRGVVAVAPLDGAGHYRPAALYPNRNADFKNVQSQLQTISHSGGEGASPDPTSRKRIGERRRRGHRTTVARTPQRPPPVGRAFDEFAPG